MTKTAFLFPGQGSQCVGMGASLMEASAPARAVMEAVDGALDGALGGDLLPLMLAGPGEELTLTRNAQPALLATALGAVRALEATTGKPINAMADYVAGHSLGEYTALAAAGVFDAEVAARLLRHRGEAMQNAMPVGTGAMAALLGVEIDAVESLLGGIEGLVEIANDNSVGQVVISGDAAAVDAAIAAAKDAGVRRAVLLPVSAPFHCQLMAPAAEAMQAKLAETEFHAPILPIFTNVTAAPENEAARLRELLVEQITARVRWRETLLNMAEHGVGRFVELGTGKVLTGLVKRTLPDAEAFNIDSAEDLETAAVLFS